MGAALQTSATFIWKSATAQSRSTLTAAATETAVSAINDPEDPRALVAQRGLLKPRRTGTELAEQDSAEATSHLASPSLDRTPVTVLAEWNGCVQAIGQHYFSASLTGLLGEGVQGEREDAEIPLSDVAESDSELLVPGNFFRLSVCYETRADGQPRRYTQVVFRRLPAYRTADLVKADERALERHRALRVE